MQEELFGDPVAPRAAGRARAGAGVPLAVRMRPTQLSEVAGQDHLLGPGAPLRRLVEGAGSASVILHGPPGTGKTTLATLVSHATGRRFEALSALSAGVKEVRAVIDSARRRLVHGEETVLFIDEIHRFSKTQQDALLGAVEDRVVLLVGATTENPSFSVVSPLLSRSLVLALRPLTHDDVRALLRRAVSQPRGFDGRVTMDTDAEDHLVRTADGDARRALTALEAAAGAVSPDPGSDPDPDDPGGGGYAVITLAVVESALDTAAVRYDRDGDQHYDVTSAFIKSIRGSDVDAALHYLARMITAGEDPRFIARRLVIHASEDVGLADPLALLTATAAAQAVATIGMPEASLALAQATIHLATAPKSPGVVAALGAAMADVAAGRVGPVPAHLRDSHYAGASSQGSGAGYRYPHDHPGGIVAQQYPPEELVGVDYYRPTTHGAEGPRAQTVSVLRQRVRGAPRPDEGASGPGRR